jgi:hypothetical protein
MGLMARGEVYQCLTDIVRRFLCYLTHMAYYVRETLIDLATGHKAHRFALSYFPPTYRRAGGPLTVAP